MFFWYAFAYQDQRGFFLDMLVNALNLYPGGKQFDMVTDDSAKLDIVVADRSYVFLLVREHLLNVRHACTIRKSSIDLALEHLLDEPPDGDVWILNDFLLPVYILKQKPARRLYQSHVPHRALYLTQQASRKILWRGSRFTFV